MFTSPSASEYRKYLLTIIKNLIIKLTKRRYYTVNVLVVIYLYGDYLICRSDILYSVFQILWSKLLLIMYNMINPSSLIFVT